MALAWLIGENNPYSDDPYFALYPRPTTASGYRLCAKIMGLREATYLDVFERRNLLSQPRWSVRLARRSAGRILLDAGEAPLILCGAKVAAAFSLPTKPFEVHELVDGGCFHGNPRKVVVIPHPSGLSRTWNESGAIARARAAIGAAVPALADKLGEADV